MNIVQIAVSVETPDSFPILYALTDVGRIFYKVDPEETEPGWKEILTPKELMETDRMN